jgi:hypothetical protein
MKRHKYTIKQVQRAIDGSGGNKAEVCRRLGTTRKTLLEYFEKFPKLKAYFDEEEERIGDLCESEIVKKIKEGNVKILIFYAKTKLRQRGYVEFRQVDANFHDNTPRSRAVEESEQEINEAAAAGEYFNLLKTGAALD